MDEHHERGRHDHAHRRHPGGTQYEVELWKATEGMDGKTTGEKPVATTGRIDLPKEAIGDFRIHPVTFTAPWFENPGVGSYQWRFKIWTPDDKGGAPTISDEVFTAFDSAADATQAGFLDDDWQSVRRIRSRRPRKICTATPTVTSSMRARRSRTSISRSSASPRT